MFNLRRFAVITLLFAGCTSNESSEPMFSFVDDTETKKVFGGLVGLADSPDPDRVELVISGLMAYQGRLLEYKKHMEGDKRPLPDSVHFVHTPAEQAMFITNPACIQRSENLATLKDCAIKVGKEDATLTKGVVSRTGSITNFSLEIEFRAESPSVQLTMSGILDYTPEQLDGAINLTGIIRTKERADVIHHRMNALFSKITLKDGCPTGGMSKASVVSNQDQPEEVTHSVTVKYGPECGSLEVL